MAEMIKSSLYLEDLDRIANMDLPWEKLEGKSLLLTGATGMIGSFMTDLLMLRNKKYDTGLQLFGVTRSEDRARQLEAEYGNDGFHALLWDVEKEPAFTGYFDYMIHGASNTHPLAYATDPVGTIRSNVLGLDHLLQYGVKEKPERLLFISSVEVYGENTGDKTYFSEEDLGYIDCNTSRAGYPESKRLCESLCRSYEKQYGIASVTGRLSRVYGPTMRKDDSKALSQFIKKAVMGENIVLKSEGTQFYSYSYVADAVAALLYLLLKGEKGESYNISDSASDITLKELAGKLAELAGTKLVFELPDALEKSGYSTATRAVLDGSKLRKLGFKASYSLEEGLEHTVKIIREMGL